MDNQPKRYRGQRGPGKRPTLRIVSVRLPQEVVDFFGGSTIRMREALVAHMQDELRVATHTEA
jgi:hypothetical protein